MTRRLTVDRLDVVVHPDTSSLAETAAEEAAATIRAAVAAKGRASAMFATGNSQLAFIERIVAMPGIPWPEVTVFHMDEYVGIGPEHPAGFRRWIRERIADKVPVKATNYIDGTAADMEGECARYAHLLATHPLDLCCLGIGENGHLAFNDPPVADFEDPLAVKVVELDLACRRQQVGEGHFRSVEAVPAHALTVTVPALLGAAHVIAVVPEGRKSQAVHAALRGPITTACPGSALRRAGRATLHLDPDSAALLD